MENRFGLIVGAIIAAGIAIIALGVAIAFLVRYLQMRNAATLPEKYGKDVVLSRDKFEDAGNLIMSLAELYESVDK